MNEPDKRKAAAARKILVLDDERPFADMLGDILNMLGYDTRICYSAREALEEISHDQFDLILSDFRMPNMDGREFYEAVASQNRALAARIIFLTGDLGNHHTRQFLQSIDNPHLAKPITLASIERALSSTLHGTAPTQPAS